MSIGVVLHGEGEVLDNDIARCELSERLVADLRARRPEAIDELLATYGRRVHGVAYLLLRSRTDAEEVVIDTMVTAWRRIETLHDPEALPAWLLRIATRHALDRRRRTQAVDPADPRSLETDATQTEALATPAPDAGLDRLVVLEALDRLPSRMRAAVVLHYYADLTVEATAVALGRSPNTIKSQLRQGLARLRTELTSETAEPSRGAHSKEAGGGV